MSGSTPSSSILNDWSRSLLGWDRTLTDPHLYSDSPYPSLGCWADVLSLPQEQLLNRALSLVEETGRTLLHLLDSPRLAI